MWRYDTKCKYMFSLKNSAHKGLRSVGWDLAPPQIVNWTQYGHVPILCLLAAWDIWYWTCQCVIFLVVHRADSRFVSIQWATSLQCNAVSHWLGANLKSALCTLWHHDNKYFLHYSPIMWTSEGNHPVTSGLNPPLAKGQWCAALIFYLFLVWTCCWTSSWIAGDLRCHDAITVMIFTWSVISTQVNVHISQANGSYVISTI